MKSFVSFILIIISAIGAAQFFADKRCNVQTSVDNRIERLKLNILNKLGLRKIPLPPGDSLIPPSNTMENFKAVQMVDEIRSRDDKPCTLANALSTSMVASSPITAISLYDDYSKSIY